MEGNEEEREREIGKGTGENTEEAREKDEEYIAKRGAGNIVSLNRCGQIAPTDSCRFCGERSNFQK